MKKKINCKHGLSNKEEIEARRLKAKLLSCDKETHKALREHIKQWIITRETQEFEDHLKNKDIVFYSAWLRFSKTVGISAIAYYATKRF